MGCAWQHTDSEPTRNGESWCSNAPEREMGEEPLTRPLPQGSPFRHKGSHDPFQSLLIVQTGEKLPGFDGIRLKGESVAELGCYRLFHLGGTVGAGHESSGNKEMRWREDRFVERRDHFHDARSFGGPARSLVRQREFEKGVVPRCAAKAEKAVGGNDRGGIVFFIEGLLCDGLIPQTHGGGVPLQKRKSQRKTEHDGEDGRKFDPERCCGRPRLREGSWIW